MIALILIVIVIISFVQPDILISKKIKQKATINEMRGLAKCNRWIYSYITLMYILTSIMDNLNGTVAIMASLILSIFFAFGIIPKIRLILVLTKQIKSRV